MQRSSMLLLAIAMLFMVMSTTEAAWTVQSDLSSVPDPTPAATNFLRTEPNALSLEETNTSSEAPANTTGFEGGAVVALAVAAVVVVGAVLYKNKNRRRSHGPLSPATPSA